MIPVNSLLIKAKSVTMSEKSLSIFEQNRNQYSGLITI